MKKIIASTVLAGLLIAGFVYASIPGPDGVIHACYRNSTGDLRAVDSMSPTCRGDETQLTWNQIGPQGAPGPSALTGRMVAGGSSAVGNGVIAVLPTCAFNEGVLSGGYRVTNTQGSDPALNDPATQFSVLESAPMWVNSAGNQNHPGWVVKILVDPAVFTGSLTVWAICVPGTTVDAPPDGLPSSFP